ncbi:MAG: hypothetical protein ACOCVF_02620 [bacterium]
MFDKRKLIENLILYDSHPVFIMCKKCNSPVFFTVMKNDKRDVIKCINKNCDNVILNISDVMNDIRKLKINRICMKI